MPYYKICVEYGRDVEHYIKADNETDADAYADDVEKEVYISVEEVSKDSFDANDLDDDLTE